MTNLVQVYINSYDKLFVISLFLDLQAHFRLSMYFFLLHLRHSVTVKPLGLTRFVIKKEIADFYCFFCLCRF